MSASDEAKRDRECVNSIYLLYIYLPAFKEHIVTVMSKCRMSKLAKKNLLKENTYLLATSALKLFCVIK